MNFLTGIIWCMSRILPATKHDLQQFKNLYMATQAEAAQALRDANTQLQKISGESTRTLQKVIELQAIIDAGAEVSPELQTAIDELKVSLQSLDDLTPDVTDGSGIPTPV